MTHLDGRHQIHRWERHTSFLTSRSLPQTLKLQTPGHFQSSAHPLTGPQSSLLSVVVFILDTGCPVMFCSREPIPLSKQNTNVYEIHCPGRRSTAHFLCFIFKLVIAGVEKCYWFLHVDLESSHLTNSSSNSMCVLISSVILGRWSYHLQKMSILSLPSWSLQLWFFCFLKTLVWPLK